MTTASAMDPPHVCTNCLRVAKAQPVQVSEIVCHHAGVRAIWQAELGDWTYRRYVIRTRPMRSKEQDRWLKDLFAKADRATGRGDS